jgi:hypothetical protein
MLRIRFLSIFIIIFLLLAFFQPSDVYSIGMAKVTVKVVDEEGQPVTDANVRVCFYGGCLKKDAEKGKTDDEGHFSVSASSYDGVIGGAVEKKGYYYSGFHHDFHQNTLGMWQPWNKEIKVVLRPKIKPVPMYVRDRLIEIPYADKEIGFDLIKFDWVIPYGQGTQSDFIFHLNRIYKDSFNFETTLTMTFPNKHDGIQELTLDRGGDFGVGSEFRLPRYAPESGYLHKLVKQLSTKSPDFLALKDNYKAYFFRVRSEVDENGNLKKAMYGKIIKDIVPYPSDSKTARIRFTYYLNPDYTSNLEYDIDANLFSPLPNREIPLRLP